MTQKAVVLLSGGLDSATTLAIACAAGFDCYCLSFDYGQRHRAELTAAVRVAAAQRTAAHRTITLDLAQFGGSALTDTGIAVPVDGVKPGIPVTYVPARNTIMLSLALAWAEVLEARDIFVGINAVDYSGYPDCRPAFVAAFEELANLATKMGVTASTPAERIRVHAPLIGLTKAQIVREGTRLGVDYALTWSCYDPARSDDGQGPHGPWAACGRCDSCALRRRGFVEAGVPDPTRYVAG